MVNKTELQLLLEIEQLLRKNNTHPTNKKYAIDRCLRKLDEERKQQKEEDQK